MFEHWFLWVCFFRSLPGLAAEKGAVISLTGLSKRNVSLLLSEQRAWRPLLYGLSLDLPWRWSCNMHTLDLVVVATVISSLQDISGVGVESTPVRRIRALVPPEPTDQN